MKKYKILIGVFLLAGSFAPLLAQDAPKKDEKSSKAWEIGLGGSTLQFNRSSFGDYIKLPDGGYQFDLKLKHAVYGGNIYLARELNSHFYVDVQGTVGFTKESFANEDENKWFFMAGVGLQWRLGNYWGSKYIDPYLRAGINYMHKDFNIFYEGAEGLAEEEMSWILNNVHNKDGVDRNDLMPISFGAGLNLWLSDRVGIGMQGDYLMMPYKNVANSMQGTVRVMYRIGGESKSPQPRIEYVEIEKIIEKTIEKPVVVEKVIEGEKVVESKTLYDHLSNINFEFDSDRLTSESQKSINEVARILKATPNRKFLVVGYTDSKGTPQYNEKLSRERAMVVVEELAKRGVSRSNLKSRGVGSKVAFAKSNASNEVREGDRKVTIEIIDNMDYWNYLSNNDM